MINAVIYCKSSMVSTPIVDCHLWPSYLWPKFGPLPLQIITWAKLGPQVAWANFGPQVEASRS